MHNPVRQTTGNISRSAQISVTRRCKTPSQTVRNRCRVRSASHFTAAGLCLITLMLLPGCMASSDSPEITFERGNILSDRGKFDDAVPLYTKALEKLSDDPEIFFRRGLCYENLNLEEKALADYVRCLELDSLHVDAINNKGVVLAKLGKFEEAAAEFTKLISEQPENVLALRNRGLCYHDLGQFDVAIADYNTALKLAPEDGNNWFQRGNIYLEQQKFEEAVADYSKAIEVAPGFAKAWMNRGVALYGLNDREAAVKDLEHARELDDNIVIPGIDWVNAANTAELAPVTEVTVAKPVLETMSSPWDTCFEFAISHLEKEGFTNIETVEEFRDKRCAKLAATQEDQTVIVYIGCSGEEQEDTVVLPAVGQEDAARALLVIRETKVPDSEDKTPAIEKYQENWPADEEDVQPVIVRVKLSR